nr:hypothetical protein [Streptomyces durhamensis]
MTYNRPHGVRRLFAAYDLGKEKLYGHVKPKKNRTRFLEFCRYLRSLYPPKIRIAIVLDNFSPQGAQDLQRHAVRLAEEVFAGLLNPAAARQCAVDGGELRLRAGWVVAVVPGVAEDLGHEPRDEFAGGAFLGLLGELLTGEVEGLTVPRCFVREDREAERVDPLTGKGTEVVEELVSDRLRRRSPIRDSARPSSTV